MTFQNAVLATMEMETRLKGIRLYWMVKNQRLGGEPGFSRVLRMKCREELGQKLAWFVTSKEDTFKTGVIRDRKVLGNKYFDVRKD